MKHLKAQIKALLLTGEDADQCIRDAFSRISTAHETSRDRAIILAVKSDALALVVAEKTKGEKKT